jgi:hypothetical protein
MIADAMRSEKSLLSIFAEDVSQNYVGKEITTRFHVLLEAASDPNMISMVESFDPDQARIQRTDYPLEKWIKDQRRENMDKAPSNSWFINDRQGLQIARDPFIDDSGKIVKTFMGDFSFRDYFHGKEKDLPEKTAGVKPITEPNICAVYVSRNSGLLKVAFSVPIWSTATDTGSRSVIGVLSTSFNLGAFEVSEQLPHSEGKQIVLVDLREDYLEPSSDDPERKVPKRGLILNHEHQSIWKKDVSPRVDPKVLAATESEEDHFVTGYHDPLSLDPGATYWGVFELVNYHVTDATTGREIAKPSDWMVLVQSEAMR